MMEKVLLLMTVIATCCAAPTDLTGKMFTFPQETGTDYVKLLTTKTTPYKAATACVRFFTDLSRDYTIFSMATRSHINAFGIFKRTISMRMLAQNEVADFLGKSVPLNKWVSLCATWSSESGLTQVWMNGQPSTRKHIHKNVPITEAPFTTLGQEQDSYGGGFDAKQSFVGMMSDVHMWDYVLSPVELGRYNNKQNFTPGNVFNWRALEFQITGNVIVENDQD